MPHLVQVQERWAPRGLRLVGVTSASPGEAEAWCAEHGVDWPVLADAEEVRDAWDVDLIWGSVYYLVDPDGQVRAEGFEDTEAVLATDTGPGDG